MNWPVLRDNIALHNRFRPILRGHADSAFGRLLVSAALVMRTILLVVHARQRWFQEKEISFATHSDG